MHLRPLRLTCLVAAVGLAAAACGDDSSSTATTAPPGTETLDSSATTAAATGDLASMTIGYSAWPGWFPLAVADEKGLFTKAGLKVDLKYFADYTASLDALSAGQLDVNAQTLNDTIFAVAAGAPETIVVTGDNSTGNDAVICDKSIASVADLKGKTVAAEAGVVDHFLLLQGLTKAGMTEKDIDFKGVKTDAAAAAFSGGQFDCVAVFAPFTTQALTRAGSHVVFSSKDFPGIIPDHLVATADLVKSRPADVQKLVNAWYATLDWIKANPDEATTIMATKAELTPAQYKEFADGTTLFDAPTALNAFADRADDPTSLPEMARRINPFLQSSGLTDKQADLTAIFDSSFTKSYVDSTTPG